MIPYLLCLVLFCVGVYGAATKRDVIKIILGLMIAEYAINMFLVLLAYRADGVSPILRPGGSPEAMSDPLPQALVLTAIVIGFATTALMIGIALRLHERFHSYDTSDIRELRG